MQKRFRCCAMHDIMISQFTTSDRKSRRQEVLRAGRQVSQETPGMVIREMRKTDGV